MKTMGKVNVMFGICDDGAAAPEPAVSAALTVGGCGGGISVCAAMIKGVIVFRYD